MNATENGQFDQLRNALWSITRAIEELTGSDIIDLGDLDARAMDNGEGPECELTKALTKAHSALERVYPA